ncbi:unnamed protein product [Camellia sinensis]
MRAVSVASPQCSSFCKDDIVPELVFKELQSSLSGHMSFHCLKDIYWDFTRPANYDSLHHSQSLVNQCRGDLLADHLTTRKCCLQVIGMQGFVVHPAKTSINLRILLQLYIAVKLLLILYNVVSID